MNCRMPKIAHAHAAYTVIKSPNYANVEVEEVIRSGPPQKGDRDRRESNAAWLFLSENDLLPSQFAADCRWPMIAIDCMHLLSRCSRFSFFVIDASVDCRHYPESRKSPERKARLHCSSRTHRAAADSAETGDMLFPS